MSLDLVWVKVMLIYDTALLSMHSFELTAPLVQNSVR